MANLDLDLMDHKLTHCHGRFHVHLHCKIKVKHWREASPCYSDYVCQSAKSGTFPSASCYVPWNLGLFNKHTYGVGPDMFVLKGYCDMWEFNLVMFLLFKVLPAPWEQDIQPSAWLWSIYQRKTFISIVYGSLWCRFLLEKQFVASFNAFCIQVVITMLFNLQDIYYFW